MFFSAKLHNQPQRVPHSHHNVNYLLRQRCAHRLALASTIVQATTKNKKDGTRCPSNRQVRVWRTRVPRYLPFNLVNPVSQTNGFARTPTYPGCTRVPANL
eukprot:2574563-Rhodomonas_salina.1